MYVQVVRGLDAPVFLWWVASCAGHVLAGIRKLSRGSGGPQERLITAAVIAVCKAVAKWHPSKVQYDFGAAASYAIKCAAWWQRRTVLLARHARRKQPAV